MMWCGAGGVVCLCLLYTSLFLLVFGTIRRSCVNTTTKPVTCSTSLFYQTIKISTSVVFDVDLTYNSHSLSLPRSHSETENRNPSPTYFYPSNSLCSTYRPSTFGRLRPGQEGSVGILRQWVEVPKVVTTSRYDPLGGHTEVHRQGFKSTEIKLTQEWHLNRTPGVPDDGNVSSGRKEGLDLHMTSRDPYNTCGLYGLRHPLSFHPLYLPFISPNCLKKTRSTHFSCVTFTEVSL